MVAASHALLAAFKGELMPYLASKATLHFSLSERPRARLIERVAKFRAKEATRRAKAKQAVRKQSR
jgi:hypothetical protein